SGGSAAVRYAVHGQWDGLGGVYGLPAVDEPRLAAAGGLHPEVLNPNYWQRAAFQGTGQLLAGARAELSLAIGYFAGDLRLPMNDSAEYGLLLNSLGGTAAGGWWIPPGGILQVTSLQHVERVNGTVAGTWRPVVPLSVRAVVGVERTDQHDDRRQRPGEGPYANPAFSSWTGGQVLNHRLTGTLVATAAVTPWSGVSLRTTLGAHYYRRALELVDSSGAVFGSAGSSSLSRLLDTVATTGLFLAQDIAVHDRLVVTSALRRDVTTHAGGTTDRAVLYPQIGVSWRGLVPRDGSGVATWRLRAAYGAVGGGQGSYFRGVSPLVAPGPAIAPLKPERTREIEAGLDAELFQGRAAFSATVYDKRTTHVWTSFSAAPSSGVLFFFSDSSVVSNKGIELGLSATVLRGPATTLSVGVSAWGNRNRVARLALNDFIGGGFGVFQRAGVDAPVGSYWGKPILGYQPIAPNGVLAPSAVQLGPAGYLGTPFPTEGTSLTSAFGWRGRIRIAALLEYRSGHSLLNATEAFRCLSLVCRAATDPSTPLAEQVPWAAWQAGTGAGWLESARFLKLREVSVIVIAPRGWSDHLGAEEMSLTLSGRNLVTWTSYKGLDPEVSAFGPAGLSIQDLFTQPLTPVWSARLDLTF
ncbi:MAG TPA: TonB-dependent receptor, partial [Gemmatimonadales bacterium]|nr:TonB-dependent receptor [Gemmatimonadales bacterium]